MNSLKIYLLLIFLIEFGSGFLFAQDLPKNITESEKAIWKNYIQNYDALNKSNQSLTTPPNFQNLRTMGEWEETEYLCITWTTYPSTLKEIVRHAQKEVKVIIACSDSNQAKSYLTSNSVPLTSNLKFLISGYNSVWTRDYGHQNIYANNADSLLLIDWIYNRPRPLDDIIPEKVSTYTGIPLYQTTQAPYKLIHTGGNFMSDGLGTGFSSNLVVVENPTLTEDSIDGIMNQFMGINRYIKMPVLPYDGIHHIDMHMKLLDEETLLVGEYPIGVSDGPQIEANLQYVLSNFNSYFGEPYIVKRIPMPPETNGTWPSNSGDYLTYANSVMVNKTILVPYYRPQYDTIALRIYQESLPAGYKVVGINCNTIIQASGALHCITKEIGAKEPLWMVHQKLKDTENDLNPYLLKAKMYHKSGIATAILYYRTDTLNTYSIDTLSYDSLDGEWVGAIPAQAKGSKVYYYIEGIANNGKHQYRPLSGPLGYYSFNVLDLTSIEKQETQFENIYPNPSKGITVIPMKTISEQNVKIELLNSFGQTIDIIYEGKTRNGRNNYFINTLDIDAGIYFVRSTADYNTVTQKLIIK